MAYQKNYTTNHTTQISLRGKFKSAAKISSVMRHNRRLGREGQGVHIDKRRQFLNRDLLGGGEPENLYVDIINRVTGEEYTAGNVPLYGKEEQIYYSDGSKLRQGRGDGGGTYDAVLAFETEMRYPGNMVWSTFDENGHVVPIPDGEEVDEVAAAPFGQDVMVDDKVIGKGKGYFLYPEDQKEFDEWCRAAVDFQKERFGENNVLSARLHMDEGTPHIHTVCAPFVKDKNGVEKLSFGKLIGGKSGFFDLQDRYADAVAHLGYKRGEQYSMVTSNLSTKEYKAGLNKVMSAEYPQDLDSAKQEIKDLRAKNYELTVRERETMSSGRTIQKLRAKTHELSEENKRLKEQFEKRQQENERLRHVLDIMERRRMFERKGQELHPNQEVVGLFRQLEAQFQEIGTQYYKYLGYNVDLRYYEDVNHDGVNDWDQALVELIKADRAE